MTSCQIVAAGSMATVQDQGRFGSAQFGVAVSGAFDGRSFALANRLVGNSSSAAAIELVMGGFAFRANESMVVAVTGAPAPISIDGRSDGLDRALVLQAGSTLTIGQPRTGVRTYLAVRGGIDVTPSMSSRSFDSLGVIGPPPLVAGDVLDIGYQTDGRPWFEQVPTPAWAASVDVDLFLGPRHDWIASSDLQRLSTMWWQISPDSNRIGLRLQGPPLARVAGELASEPMMFGAVQVPPNGQPIVLGPDGGVTGGYPVVGVVAIDQLYKLGQLRPGNRLRFRVIEPR